MIKQLSMKGSGASKHIEIGPNFALKEPYCLEGCWLTNHMISISLTRTSLTMSNGLVLHVRDATLGYIPTV